MLNGFVSGWKEIDSEERHDGEDFGRYKWRLTEPLQSKLDARLHKRPVYDTLLVLFNLGWC
jgi:hypothetical protein